MRNELVPATLFARLMSALLAVIGAAVLITAVLLVRERRELTFWGGEAAAVASAIAETSMALAVLPADARAAEVVRLRATPITIARSGALREPRSFDSGELDAALSSLRSRLERDLGAGYRIDVRPARPGPPSADAIRIRTRSTRDEPFAGGGGPPDPRGFDREREGFEQRGGPDAPGGLEPRREPRAERELAGPDGPGGPRGEPGGRMRGPPPRELDVAVTLPDGVNVQFRTDAPRAGPPLPTRIFAELALLTVVLGVVLYFMARTITRPLTELARAADAVGRGERHPPVRETGARELREATHAFNVMQERLNRYLDSRTQVLAAMSHDLRTPLTRLKLRVESIDDPIQRERFGADLDETIGMVTNALNLFKGVDDEPLQSVDVGAMLDELRREFTELSASVAVVGKPREPLVAKPQALKRCITNLVSNAVKYGGGATVVVDDGAELVLRVLDEGPGIPEESLERVFEPFFRLETSRNSATGGTGLGLGIARDIAQAHGGSLMLRNREPRGVEAVLRLPRHRA